MISALTVLYFILPLPVAFVVHDTEEILTQKKWMKSHKDGLLKKFPKMSDKIEQLSSLGTVGFSIAALEELVFLLLCTCNALVEGPFCVEIWAALFMAFSFHLLIHIAQAIAVKGYVPGLISSIVILPYAFIGIRSIVLVFPVIKVILLFLIGVLFVDLNLKFAHYLGRKIAGTR